MNVKTLKIVKKIPLHLVAVFVVIISISPLIIVFHRSILTGFNENRLSFSLYLELLLLTPEYFNWFWNSFSYTFFILIFNVPLSLLAGFAFSRYKNKWIKAVFTLYIILMLMPFQATIVPQYLTLQTLNLMNTPFAIILPNIFGTFGAFLMSQSMKSIPNDIFEAARLDGVSEFSLFLKIAVPLSKSAISALVILLFIDSWSMVEQPTIFLQDPELYPLSMTLTKSMFGEIVFVASVIFSIFPVLIYIRENKKLISGMSLVAVK